MSDNDRWQNLKSFIAEYYRPLTPVDGVPVERVEAAEKELGFRLPEALRELYMLIGANEDLTGQENYLTPLDDLEIEDGYLWVWNENQGVWFYAIAEAELASSDPPTQFIMDEELDESESGKLLSDTALLMVALDLIMAGTFSAYGSAGPMIFPSSGGPYDIYEGKLNEILGRGELSPYPVLAANRFFVVEGVLAQSDGDGLRILAPDKPALLQAMNKLDQLDWSYNSIEDN
jgi:hypothetical protein